MMETDMKTRHKLIRLLSKVQDNGETWRVDAHGCNLCEMVRNAKVADFLIENGVGFVTDINVGSKRETIAHLWIHDESYTGHGFSRCGYCNGTLDGYVQYRYCPHCGTPKTGTEKA